MRQGKVHRNDMYGDHKQAVEPAIPAATVVLLRDTDQQGEVEVLMLQKNKNISFGGMWVFPGGRIDDADYSDIENLADAARQAAMRETEEETGLKVSSDEFVWFAHWTPPPGTQKRYATWFFAAALDTDEAVEVDGQEILNHRWIGPAEALKLHAKGEIDLVPPTWITLYQLGRHGDTAGIIEYFRSSKEKTYETRVAKSNNGLRVAMWAGDAGYESWDADIEGERHRLVLAQGGFRFENSTEEY